MTLTNANKAQACLDAIEILDTRGHTKFISEDVNGVCLAGAINKSYFYGENRSRVSFGSLCPVLDEIAQEQWLDRCAKFPYGDPRQRWNPSVRFNNHPDTTKEDVILLLEKAAVKFMEMVD